MDVVWIQVFILTFAECVAPAGKSVCQPQQFEMQFVTRSDCDYALQQLIRAKDELDNVIVDRVRSGCAPTAVKTNGYKSAEEIAAANEGNAEWRAPGNVSERRAVTESAHRERLQELKSCDETKGAAPCKVGDIIVEDTRGDSVEVWREGN